MDIFWGFSGSSSGTFYSPLAGKTTWMTHFNHWKTETWSKGSPHGGPLLIQTRITLVLQQGMPRAVLDSVILCRCCVGGDKHCETSYSTGSGHHMLGFTWASSTWTAKNMEHTPWAQCSSLRETTCDHHSQGEPSLESRLGFVFSCWQQQTWRRCWSPGILGERCFGSLL